MPVTVAAGTRNPIDLISDPDTGLKAKYRYPNIRLTVTNLTLMPESLFEQMRDFINLWQHTSDEPPTWLSCPDAPVLQAALQDHYKVGGPPDPDDPDTVIFDLGDEDGDNVGVRELVDEGLDVDPNPGGDAAPESEA